MGAGPLHLLKSGLVVRLEEEGHQITIRSIDLPPDFRATELASAFELSAALAGGVAEAAKIGSFPLGSLMFSRNRFATNGVHASHVRPLEGRRLLFIEIANPNRAGRSQP